MSNHTQKAPGTYPSRGRTARVGIGFGAIAGLIAIAVAMAVFAALALVSGGLEEYRGAQAGFLSTLFTFGIVGLIIALPIGALMGCISALLMHRHWLTTSISVDAGIRLGFLRGLVPGILIGVGLIIPSKGTVVQEGSLVLFCGLIGSFSGAWHGRQMACWLERQRELLSGNDSET